MSHKSEFESPYPADKVPTKLDSFLELLEVDNPHPSSLRFYELILDAAKLHAKKQKDYGSDHDPFANVRASEQFGIPGWVGAFTRLYDKVIRIMNFARKGVLANESAEDSMIDIAVYALIGLVMYEEESEK